MSLITIEQLLESVDLDFEPRWVTKDDNGTISIFAERPECRFSVWASHPKLQTFGRIKLAEFENKDWQECIYEVPRKTTGKIELLTSDGGSHPDHYDFMQKINELVAAVNELMGDKHPISNHKQRGNKWDYTEMFV